ncbi:hypothetical protein [Litoribacter populi]|uniref:hypothetical protein n=1 Tax=Litoribacter populi TaxID=2598460 RepID=UPI0011816F2D|nr:hypothetical protein [Litoribacter populi]
MDAGTLIYIALVILYFLFTAFRKKDKPQEDERFEGEQEGERRPASFEDMLKEIRREQQERTRDFEDSGQGEVLEEVDTYEEHQYSEPKPEPKPKPKPKPQSEPTNPYRKYYEGGEGSLKNTEKAPLKTLDEQVDISIDDKIIGEVEDVAEVQSAVNPYAKLLKNPSTVKDAVILTEILNRKYF